MCYLSGVEAPVLTECDRVLDPGGAAPDEVDGDVLPVVVVTRVQPEGVTAALQAVPEMPGQLQEVATSDNFVVNRRVLAKWRAEAVIGVTGLIRVTIVLSSSVKSDQRSGKWVVTVYCYGVIYQGILFLPVFHRPASGALLWV